MKLHVKKNDTVVVISGKDEGKKGKVIGSFPDEGRILVEGINMITRHVKPRSRTQVGGIVKQEGAISASNVMLYCPKCDRPVRTRRLMHENGKTRVCARCRESLD